MEPNERAATNAPVCRARRRRGHGEGSIRRRADSRWEARLLPERREGRTKRVSYINRDKAAVVRWLNEKLVEQQNGTLVDPSRVTLETFIRQHYLPTAKATLKPRASADYKRRREH